MKRILKCLLAFFILFSTVDLSVINLCGTVCSNGEKMTTISELVKIECALFCQTKNVVANMCDNIVKDVQLLLTPTQHNKTFFDTDKTERRIYTDNYFNYVKVLLLVSVAKSVCFIDKTKFLLFFFGFVFMFILKYLGLLFTFGKVAFRQHYKTAYIN